MKKATAKKRVIQNVDRYISGFPDDVRLILGQIRTAIQQAIPDATESISYGIPAYKQRRAVIYFAAWKSHVAIYPINKSVRDKFAKQLSQYELEKNTLRFGFKDDIPLVLIGKIARFLAQEIDDRAD